jgi:hypothetical protein
MSNNLTSIDITTLKLSDLFLIVEEVKTIKKPRILKVHSETLAILMPEGIPVPGFGANNVGSPLPSPS